MRHVSSTRIEDLAAIYENDVELVSVARPVPKALDRLCKELFASRKTVQTQWTQKPSQHDASERALSDTLDPGQRNALSCEIGLAGDVLSELLGCDAVGVRVTTLRGPMCPRFHVDQVPCRLLMTLGGPGTEWIASDDVDRARLADRSTDIVPLRVGQNIRRLTSGNWSLLKGGSWIDGFAGTVHRSPQRLDERLLVSLDPLFPEG